jgi:hypothetical protein
MATNVDLAINEMTEFDLPRVCVITGNTEGVIFKDVKFQWYPRWIGAFGIAPIIMIIMMSILMRRAKGKLPFTEAAWDAWQRGKILMGLSIVVGIAMLFGGIFLMEKSGAAGGLLLFLAVALPIAVGVTQLRGKGVTCIKIDKTTLQLKFPSDEAANKFRAHLRGGA